jgi:dolichol-phosphate mannosyltransferase
MQRNIEQGTKTKEACISIVVPVYNEEAGIQEFYKRIKKVTQNLDCDSTEIIFIDDGSQDSSYRQLIELAQHDSTLKVIKFSRNFGHQIAISAGMENAKGDAVVIIDADLQDPPEVIHQFIAKWKEGFDVVFGVRITREGESRLKLWTAAMFYRILRFIAQIDIPVDTGDFRLMSRRALKHVIALPERDRFVRGLVSWIGFKQCGVSYSREKRNAGETKYPYRKMLRFALDGITSFSNLPLKLASFLGYLTSFLAFLYACGVFIQKAMGYTVQGWATIMVGLLFLGGVQLVCLGIIGEYIGRIFNETKNRPLYIIEEVFESRKNGEEKEDVGTVTELGT